MRKGILIIMFLLVACGPRSPKDCRKQGEGVMRALLQEIESIDTTAELMARKERLMRLYIELAEVMIRAEKASQKWVEPPSGEINYALNERLRSELIRLYEIPGAREIVEAAQTEALYRLDQFTQNETKMANHGFLKSPRL